MKTEMIETVYCRQDTAGTLDIKVKRIVFNAAKFAEMENTAFGEDAGGRCMMVREASDAPISARGIQCRTIGAAIETWARETLDWGMEFPDETGIGESALINEKTGDWSDYAHRTLRIVISDIPYEGGMRLEAFDTSGAKISGIAFVPEAERKATHKNAKGAAASKRDVDDM